MQTMTPFRAHAAPSRTGTRLASQGFTIIEVMIVVAIMAILLALAGPSFTGLIERWRVRDSAESLTSSLYHARSEAIKRGGNVIIVKYANSGACTTATANTEWGCGWHVFFDANGNGSQDACVAANTPNECDIQTTPAPIRMQIKLPSSTGSITVDRWGMLSHTGGAATPTSMAFELMPKDKTLSDASAAKLCTGTGGRIVRVKGNQACP
jgi:type IV fimbrial biogenesis protein FimT